jgi:F0F1-type ATP synthase assembly protein I
MAENIVEKADAQVAESIRKLTRATSAMAEAIDEGVGAIKLAVKRSGDLAEEMMDDTTQRVKRHPVETMVATFSVGIIVGGFIGWMVFRK